MTQKRPCIASSPMARVVATSSQIASVDSPAPAITRETSFFANTRASNLRSPSELLLGNMRGLQSLLARRPVREVVHRDGGGSSAKIEQD